MPSISATARSNWARSSSTWVPSVMSTSAVTWKPNQQNPNHTPKPVICPDASSPWMRRVQADSDSPTLLANWLTEARASTATSFRIAASIRSSCMKSPCKPFLAADLCIGSSARNDLCTDSPLPSRYNRDNHLALESVMRVGVPKEIKNHEYRVGLTPPSVSELTAAGHEVIVQTGAGMGIDYEDSDYVEAGARIVSDVKTAFAESDMIVKVKEPQPQEVAMLEPRHLLFTYLHLAADKPQAEGLMKSGATCIAYETVTANDRSLPLLKPMSEVAGRMSIQVGAHYLEKEQGGRGVLLGGVPGVAPARVAILGGGVSGVNAAQMAVGMRADVTIYDINMERLAELDMFFSSQIKTAYASRTAIANAVSKAELVIGAVLVPGAAAPI